jgi:hypothetical protein
MGNRPRGSRDPAGVEKVGSETGGCTRGSNGGHIVEQMQFIQPESVQFLNPNFEWKISLGRGIFECLARYSNMRLEVFLISADAGKTLMAQVAGDYKPFVYTFNMKFQAIVSEIIFITLFALNVPNVVITAQVLMKTSYTLILSEAEPTLLHFE